MIFGVSVTLSTFVLGTRYTNLRSLDVVAVTPDERRLQRRAPSRTVVYGLSCHFPLASGPRKDDDDVDAPVLGAIIVVVSRRQSVIFLFMYFNFITKGKGTNAHSRAKKL